MRWSQTFVPTLKETPSEAEIASHKLLLRAGLIRKLTGGLYTFLPMGLRSLQKISQIIREEMDRAGGLEVLMPVSAGMLSLEPLFERPAVCVCTLQCWNGPRAPLKRMAL